MSRKYVNTLVKLKSGGGLVNSATDGLSLKAGDTLPAMDGSNLLNVGFYNSDIKFPGSSAAITAKIFNTSNTDGTIIIITVPVGNSTVTVYRLEKKTTGLYEITHVVTVAMSTYNVTWSRPVIVGSYVYFISFDANSSYPIKRLLLSNLTGITDMSVSGAAPAYDGASFSDGIFVYFYKGDASPSVFTKYSISGTTLTNIEDITFTSSNLTKENGICDGTNVYLIDNTAAPATIKKYNKTGGASTATLASYYYNLEPNQAKRGILINNAVSLNISTVSSITSDSAIVCSKISLNPIINL